MNYFEAFFLSDATIFLEFLDPKIVKKIIYIIDLAQHTNDATIFKKLRNNIWEFRIQYSGIQIRLLAFWDKTDQKSTLVVITHGIIKKTQKTPKNEIEKAIKLRELYFNNQ
jgi:phage-related protein